jgi:glutamate-1-semialdehyde 2,1-aminomutase
VSEELANCFGLPKWQYTSSATHANSEAIRVLGERLAGGMRASVVAHGLPWHIHHLGPRSGYTFQPTPIRSGAEGRACADELLTRLVRIWLANRGVWEAIVGAGPVCSVPAGDEDVDAYLAARDSLLDALTA